LLIKAKKIKENKTKNRINYYDTVAVGLLVVTSSKTGERIQKY